MRVGRSETAAVYLLPPLDIARVTDVEGSVCATKNVDERHWTTMPSSSSGINQLTAGLDGSPSTRYARSPLDIARGDLERSRKVRAPFDSARQRLGLRPSTRCARSGHHSLRAPLD